MARPTYEVVPRPRQRDARAQPDEWAITKGNSTIQTFQTKLPATQRAKELAKNQQETLAIYDAAKKRSEEFDYRSEAAKKAASRKANRKAVSRGLGDNFGPL